MSCPPQKTVSISVTLTTTMTITMTTANNNDNKNVNNNYNNNDNINDSCGIDNINPITMTTITITMTTFNNNANELMVAMAAALRSIVAAPMTASPCRGASFFPHVSVKDCSV